MPAERTSSRFMPAYAPVIPYDAFVEREKFGSQLTVIPLARLCVAAARQTGNFAGA
jgi:hypothetical protein